MAKPGYNPKPYKGRPTSSHKPSLGKEGSCCPMVAAGHALRQGRYRLARRYAAMSVRLIAGRMVSA